MTGTEMQLSEQDIDAIAERVATKLAARRKFNPAWLTAGLSIAVISVALAGWTVNRDQQVFSQLQALQRNVSDRMTLTMMCLWAERLRSQNGTNITVPDPLDLQRAAPVQQP